MINPTTNNNANIANSGINKLADTAAAQLGNTSSPTSNQFNNSHNSNNTNNNSISFLEQNNINFLEADASFASGMATTTGMSTLPVISAPTMGVTNVSSGVNVTDVNAHSAVPNTSSFPPRMSSASSEYKHSPHTQSNTTGAGMGAPSPSSGNTSFVTSLTTNKSNFSSVSSSTAPPASKRKKTASAKQHQLPMFLTKTYHMIDRCDGDVALWAEDGESFVVKNVEKFATNILPQYFKHSNFSSFARQLNFYGFRKLKAEPILTADYDARTASYVRFYHEHFQRGKPELLVHIKRATKSDVQSKDDVDQLRMELHHALDKMGNMSLEFDRKLTEISFDMNSKIAALHGKIAELQTTALNQQRVIQQNGLHNNNGGGNNANSSQQQQQANQQQQQQQHQQQQQQQQHVGQQQQQQTQQTQFVTQTQQPQQTQYITQNQQQQQQYIPVHPQHNNGSSIGGNKMNGLLAAGLSIKSPALPSQPHGVGGGHPGTSSIPGLSDNMMLPPAQK